MVYGPNNNIQRMESGEEGEIGEDDGEVAPRTPRGRGRGGMMRGGGGRRGGRGGRGRWGSPRSNSFRGFRNEGPNIAIAEGIHRSQSMGGEQSPWNNNNSFRRRDSFRNPDFPNEPFRQPHDARGGPVPPPPLPHDEFGRSPMNIPQHQQYQRGPPPMDQRGGGGLPPIMEQRGGPPIDQRNGSSMDPRGGPLMDQRGGPSGPPMDQRGPPMMDQRGPPLDQRGGHPMDQRGGGGPKDQRGPIMDQQGGPPMDPRGMPPIDPRGGNRRHQQPIAPPPPPPHLLGNTGMDGRPPPGNFSPFPDGNIRKNDMHSNSNAFRGRNDFREPQNEDKSPFQFGRNRDSFGGAEPRHFPPRRDEHPANRRMNEPFQRDSGMMEPRSGVLFPEGPVSGNVDNFPPAPGMRGADSFARDGMWNSNERPQEQFQRQTNPSDSFQQPAEEQFPPPQRSGSFSSQPPYLRESVPYHNTNKFPGPPGGPFQPQPPGPHFQRDTSGGQFQRSQDSPFGKPSDGPIEQSFRPGRGGRRNDFNRRSNVDRSFRDMDQPLGQTTVEEMHGKPAEQSSLTDISAEVKPNDAQSKPVEPKAEPQPLSSLEERDQARARAIVIKIGDVLGLPLSTDHLPQKKDITKSMEALDLQIKAAGSDVAKHKKAMEEALAYEREQANVVKEEAIAQATEQAFLRLKREESKEQAEVDEFESTLSDYVKKEEEKFHSKQDEQQKALQAELSELKDQEEKKQREVLNEQMIQTADDFDQKILELHGHLDRATSLVKKHNSRLSVLQEKAGTHQPFALEQKEGSSLVSRIIAENRAKAAKSHMLSLGNIQDGIDDSSKIDTFKDPKFNRSISEWSTLRRQVTGKSSALYREPSEAPYFESNEKKHEQIAPYISEFIKQRQEKLTEHWVEIAKVYEKRRKVFKKKMGKRSRKSSSSIPARQLPVTQIGGGSSSTVSRPNPYRRARREVRSDYEQEQLLEELKLAEAMEKRIQFGGCKIPRQVVELERKLTPQFRNTFEAQRIDVIELEQSLLNTSVWSDMEKCIFLDRWLQFPKDFRKIATFLRNKTTKDCIRFYYDSKQAVPYKAALREHHLRRKRRGITWEGTFEAAVSVGAVVKAGLNEQKPLVFLLPDNDNTFRTRKFHPLKREIFDCLEMRSPAGADSETGQLVDNERPHKRQCLRQPLFTPSEEQAKFLKTQQEPMEEKTDDEFVQEEAVAAAAAAPVARRPRQKWSVEEKGIFAEILARQSSNSRPDWKAFSEALSSKTLEQIKNFYYDNKKLPGRNKGERRKQRRQDEVTTPTQVLQSDSVISTPSLETSLQARSIAGDQTDQMFGNLDLHSIQQPPLQQHHHHHSHSYNELYGGERSRTSTPDPMDLAWAQQLLMGQGGETARRLLQSQHQQQHHHQLLSSLMPWEWNEQHQHQQLLLRLQQQQQTNQQLAALGLGGYRQDDAQLALAQHLLNLQSGNGNYRNGGHGGNHPPRAPR